MKFKEAAIPVPGRKYNLWLRLLPILFFLGYLNLSILLFAFGPWPWPIDDGTKLYTFLMLAHLALLVGYLSAAFCRPRGYYAKWKIEHIVIMSLIVNFLLLFPTSAFRTQNWIPNIWGGIADPGSIYHASNEWRAKGGGLAEYIRIILGPLLILLLPLTVYYWQRLRLMVKTLSAVTIAGYISIYVALGTNKGIADLALLTPCLILTGYLAGFLKLNWRRVGIAILLCIGVFLFFLWFFSYGQVSRVGPGWNYFPLTDTYADSENFLVRDLPESAKVGMISLANYLTQGYYGLYLSLEEPFVPMFGVGNSMFLYFNAIKLTGMQEIGEMPYPVRLQNKAKWNAYGNWSSIYPWIASDVSFPGTLLVMLLMGRLFGLSWLDALKGSNPFAVAVFSQFLIMLFYFPANNQIFQTGEALTSFLGSLALWMFTRRKYVWGRQMQ